MIHRIVHTITKGIITGATVCPAPDTAVRAYLSHVCTAACYIAVIIMAVLNNEIADTIPCYWHTKIKLNPVIREKITRIIICRTVNNSCGRIKTAKFCITRPTIGNTNIIQIHPWRLIYLKLYTCNT